MSLSISSSNLSEQLVKLPQKKITQVILFVLIIYIAYLFAQATWLFVPQQESAKLQPAQQERGGEAVEKAQINMKQIQALSLFGKFIKPEERVEEKVVIEDAPETRLKLTLSGVVASNDKTVASAIIANAGKQETYGIGENIKGTRAVLENVFSDRVLIKVSGRLETLMFEGLKFNKSIPDLSSSKQNSKNARNKSIKNSKTAGAKVVDQRKNRSLIAATTSLKKQLDSDPGKITDYLKITPKRVNRKIVGYQLLPGKDPTFFKSAGLKSGDIAVQMNGFDLTIAKEAAQAMRTLKEQQEISLLLDRNGELTEILFGINN